ncbi:hypothetical protein BZG36_04977 [Bifiguratus adelaidae]|uniref:ER membrane protein complex subunit 2 n=1 Tax=Bifiguratus adelaidae TaxID=1938954 RepID=A0A261XV33_9FUNG|nr:hypothetical protein BZG36_04977 [Bifiguratus adelaidae]
MDVSSAVDALRALRIDGVRESEHAYRYGKVILDAQKDKSLGEEVWAVYEQITVAALDVGEFSFAQKCIDRLKARFPKSARVKRLVGMKYEAEGNLDKAAKEYDEILEEDETNMASRFDCPLPAAKRKVALLKERGNIKDAIASCTQIIDNYYNDAESWLELAELHLCIYQYEQAAFCLEELILLHGANHIFYLKYADVMYTMGEIELALKNYLKVIELCKDHVRGMYGCTRKMSNDEINDALNELATERLLAVYSSQKSSNLDVLRQFLE